MEIYETPEILDLGDAARTTLASLTSSPADKCGACQGTGLAEDSCPEELA